MRQVLFWIPLDAHLPASLGGFPVLGWGVALVLWLIWTAVRTGLEVRAKGANANVILENLVPRLIIAVVIVLLPQFIQMKRLPIFGYGAAMVVGFLLAATLAGIRAKREGIAPEVMWDVGLLILMSGVIGARLFHIVWFSDQYFVRGASPGETLFRLIDLPSGGLVLYGGVILGFVAFLWFCHRKHLSPLQMADLMIPSIFVGECLGRIGCFLNGCCYGDPCTLPWAVQFPQHSLPYNVELAQGLILPTATASLPLHPAQLYSSLNALLLAVITWNYFPYRSRKGEVVLIGAILYPITRFGLEIVRGDTAPYAGLTVAQWVSVGMLVCAGLYACWLYRKPKSTVSAGVPVRSTVPSRT